MVDCYNPCLVLVQPRKTSPYITERLLMGRKESNQTTNKNSLSASVQDECCLLITFVHSLYSNKLDLDPNFLTI